MDVAGFRRKSSDLISRGVLIFLGRGILVFPVEQFEAAVLDVQTRIYTNGAANSPGGGHGRTAFVAARRAALLGAAAGVAAGGAPP